MSFKVYEIDSFDNNIDDYNVYILTEEQRKELRQKNGYSYLEFYNGRNWESIEFDYGKASIRQNYFNCKEKMIINDYFATGYDLVIFKLKDSNLFCRSSRWQGDNPLCKLILYNQEPKTIEKIEKDFAEYLTK